MTRESDIGRPIDNIILSTGHFIVSDQYGTQLKMGSDGWILEMRGEKAQARYDTKYVVGVRWKIDDSEEPF